MNPAQKAAEAAQFRYVTIGKFAELSGYTQKAIRRKIEEGIWIENRQYRRAPDNRLLIDVQGVEAWAAGQLEPSNRSGPRSGSNSRSMGRAA